MSFNWEDYELKPEHFEIAAKNGIEKHLVRQRVNSYGWIVQDAITKPKGWNLWKEWGEIALSNGISKGNFYVRMSNGKTPEEAATTKKKWIERPKLAPETYAKAAEIGLDRQTVNERVFVLHWTEERACSEPLGKRGGYRGRRNGKKA